MHHQDLSAGALVAAGASEVKRCHISGVKKSSRAAAFPSGLFTMIGFERVVFERFLDCRVSFWHFLANGLRY